MPSAAGRDAEAILAAAKDGSLGALLVGGIDPYDFADPDAVLAALDAAGFIVSLELRHSAVTERADVVFPIAPAAEKAGTYVNWEGRQRSFSNALPPTATPDCRVLDTLADELGIDLGFPTVAAGLAELNGLGTWDGVPPPGPTVAAAAAPKPSAGEAILAGWRMLLDDGQLQDGEPHLAGTARTPVVRLSAATASGLGAADGDNVTVSTAHGSITLPLTITDDARPRGMATAELTRLGGAPATGRHARRRGEDWSGAMTGFGHDTWWLILAKSLLVFVFLVLTVLVAILAERKILGRMQMRWGPNRVGPRGYLQSLADGIKLALKEPIIPFGVEKPIFLLAPAISTIPAITAFAFIPFGPQVSVFGHWTPLQVTDLPVAVLFILALSSIGVYGIVLAGWSSGSTYPLLGGVRSTAQVISYEVAMGLSFATVFLYAGTMSTSQIVTAQNRVWYIFLLLPSFCTYLVSMVGETNRAPFDLPEAEGELVAGFHTEYSSLSFAMFFLAEYINMTTVSALAATLFMGGWHAPWPLNMWAGANSGFWPVLWFTAKVWVFLFIYIWLRGVLPRLRYDQFMALGWKILIPVSLVWALIAAGIRTLRDQGYAHWTTLLVGRQHRRHRRTAVSAATTVQQQTATQEATPHRVGGEVRAHGGLGAGVPHAADAR